MSLARDYERQFRWRAWNTILDALPSLVGQAVLDLGCAVGDQAAELVARGARVIGFDGNEELLEVARSRGLPNAEFHNADLHALPNLGEEIDGIWCSFAAAYFTDLSGVLAGWRDLMRLGGWIALTEVEGLFGHNPLSNRSAALLRVYARESLDEARYDFHMGGKLESHLKGSGFTVEQSLIVEDQKFSFTGPAPADVVDAWRARFDRMKLLRDFCGTEFDRVRGEFLDCLTRSDHESEAQVHCCIATK